MSGAPVIRVSGLATRFGEQVVHENLDLEVRRGEVLAVVGGSGTGKSVLLREMLGLMPVSAGRIEILGRDITSGEPEALGALRTRCGVLFQNGALFSALTVRENVETPLREFTDLSPGLITELARIKIAMAGLRPEAADKYPSELSGGMVKRAALARALALDPEILFLDEPTAGLDPIGAAKFDALIKQLRESLELTVVMITHDLDSLVAIATRVAAIIDKRIVADSLDRLRRLEHPWIREYFGGPRGRQAMAAIDLMKIETERRRIERDSRHNRSLERRKQARPADGEEEGD
jgi:phospholipid/cholesterol/gamma-HCH transport system ATP-binding protein